jgi:hypothetical protein
MGTDDTHVPLSGLEAEGGLGRRAAAVALGLVLAAGGAGALAGADTWITPARGPSTQVGWAAPPSSSGSNTSGGGYMHVGGAQSATGDVDLDPPPSSSGSNTSGTGHMRVGGGRVSLAGDPDDGGQISLAGDPDDGGQLSLIVHELA